jgi:hypothetical protein
MKRRDAIRLLALTMLAATTALVAQGCGKTKGRDGIQDSVTDVEQEDQSLDTAPEIEDGVDIPRDTSPADTQPDPADDGDEDASLDATDATDATEDPGEPDGAGDAPSDGPEDSLDAAVDIESEDVSSDEAADGPTAAPDFGLEDLSPDSPTHGIERRVSDEIGKVLLLYFVSYT